MSHTVIVCGGRDFSDRRALFAALDLIWATDPKLYVITGGAKGADTLAKEWADTRGVPGRVMRANWSTHGPAAGPIRNLEMLSTLRGRRTLGDRVSVVAFPGGKGTAHMIGIAEKDAITVIKPLELTP